MREKSDFYKKKNFICNFKGVLIGVNLFFLSKISENKILLIKVCVKVKIFIIKKI
jgi:uncharacterized Fe-S cluster-containing radical SAM superfamily protein